LRGLFLFGQRNADFALEELDLLLERPGPQDPPQQRRRRTRHEAREVRPRGKDVAPPSAADQDLAPAVGGGLDQGSSGAFALQGTARGGEEGRDRSRGAGADDDYAPA